jgi:hypothetical protein
VLWIGLRIARESRREERRAHAARALEHRYKAPLDPHWDQGAGEKCAKCKERIVVNRDGARCPIRRAPLHIDRAGAHARKCSISAATPSP